MLTDSVIRSAKRAEQPRKLSDGGGLYLLVAPNGGRYWRFNYRFKGKQKTLALGVYPDVGLAKARERLLEARQLPVDGIDPSHERRAAGKTFALLRTHLRPQTLRREKGILARTPRSACYPTATSPRARRIRTTRSCASSRTGTSRTSGIAARS